MYVNKEKIVRALSGRKDGALQAIDSSARMEAKAAMNKAQGRAEAYEQARKIVRAAEPKMYELQPLVGEAIARVLNQNAGKSLDDEEERDELLDELLDTVFDALSTQELG